MTISNSDDLIDSRDIIERIAELRGSNDKDDREERKILIALAEECEQSEDWPDGATLIRDRYWANYAQQLVEEVGDLPSNLPSYIENNIDWGGVADDLKGDYFSVDFDGAEYWLR